MIPLRLGAGTPLVYSPHLRNLIHPLLVFAITLVAYVLTMPRTITLEDAGLFQMVCHLGGIAHPPGYPLFTLLCGEFVQLAITGNSVVNGNLLSAVFGALASALLFHVAERELGDRVLAYLVGLGWGLSAAFWSQAIIIEVYTLAALMFAVCWVLLTTFVRTLDQRWWWAACLAFGLSLSNHWPIALLSAPALAVVVVPAINTVLERLRSPVFILLSLSLFILGLCPYLALFNSDPAIAVFGGVDSIERFVRYVTRAMYSDDHLAAGDFDRLYYAIWVVGQSLMQLGPLGLPLIIIGSVASFVLLSRTLAISLLLLWLGGTLILVALLNFQFTHYYQAVFLPYPIVAYAAVAFWAAIGTGVLITWLKQYSNQVRWILPLTFFVSAVLWNYPRVDRHDASIVDHFARLVLESLPPDSVLFTRGDNFTGPIGYLRYVEGVREDVEVRDWENLVFRNRLSSPFLPPEEQDAEIVAYIERSKRPVFTMEPRVSPFLNYGAYFEYDPGGNGFGFRPELEAFADLLVATDVGDLVNNPHEQRFVFDLLSQYARQHVAYSLRMPDRVSQAQRERTMLLQSTFAGKLALLELIVSRGNIHDRSYTKEQLLSIAIAAERQIPDEITREALAVLNELTGRIHMMPPADVQAAALYFSRSLESWPLDENRSICRLHAVLVQGGQKAEATRLLQRFPRAACLPVMEEED